MNESAKESALKMIKDNQTLQSISQKLKVEPKDLVALAWESGIFNDHDRCISTIERWLEGYRLQGEQNAYKEEAEPLAEQIKKQIKDMIENKRAIEMLERNSDISNLPYIAEQTHISIEDLKDIASRYHIPMKNQKDS